MQTVIDFRQLEKFLGEACDHYETSAPTVHSFCDALFIRLHAEPDEVRLSEITGVLALSEDGRWEQPNYAANRIYKLQSRLGQETTGHAGF